MGVDGEGGVISLCMSLEFEVERFTPDVYIFVTVNKSKWLHHTKMQNDDMGVK